MYKHLIEWANITGYIAHYSTRNMILCNYFKAVSKRNRLYELRHPEEV